MYLSLAEPQSFLFLSILIEPSPPLVGPKVVSHVLSDQCEGFHQLIE